MTTQTRWSATLFTAPLHPAYQRDTTLKHLCATAARVALFLIVIIVFMGAQELRGQAIRQAIADHINTYPTTTYTVQSGDTLLEIAARTGISHIKNADVVSWIKLHNNLDSSTLMPGQQLVIPGPSAA